MRLLLKMLTQPCTEACNTLLQHQRREARNAVVRICMMLMLTILWIKRFRVNSVESFRFGHLGMFRGQFILRCAQNIEYQGAHISGIRNRGVPL